nr:type I secretion system permease/ATPase [Ensifer sp. ENS07]
MIALRDCRGAFIAVGTASALVNILYLTGSFFMLEVYDRVLPSRSIPSLIALSLLALLLYSFQGAFELARGRMLVRIAGVLDETLGTRIYRAIVKAPLKLRIHGDGLQALRDFDQVRSFLSGPGPAALFDLPWLPFYILICFLFHPIIGLVAIGGGFILILLTYLTNRSTQAPAEKASEAVGFRNVFAQSSQSNAEVVQAMGMVEPLAALWEQRNAVFRDESRRAADIGNGYAALSKIFRMALQSGVLAAGAVLVIEEQATPGIIIAGSILTARALAPVELAITNWRSLVAARQSWARLTGLLKALPEDETSMVLPGPHKYLSVENLSSGPPATQRIVVTDTTFTIRAGSALAVIGPSASGKSSLARAILGLWPAHRGSVRLDGAALNQWDSEALGKHVGYLPQNLGLFAGTVAQNICRFAADATSEAIVAAAKAAAVNDLILRLPNGYDTEIGEAGMLLSAGQRQRVALARALFGDPFLVVLDEPNSNLDAEGEYALGEAIMKVRARGGIVVVIAHRPSALSSVDLILMMNEGRMQVFGAKDEVLAKVLRPQQLTPPSSFKIVADGHEAKQ